tara:strand:- start:1084 stop:1932 length:849 start_codon:yes stop_codon:yes gene_type:complete
MEENQTTAPEQNLEQPGAIQEQPQETNWMSSLPSDLQTNDSLTKFSSVESLAKSYINAQGIIGADKIVKPTNNFTEEDWSNFHSAAGRPDEAKGYELNYETETPEVLDNFKTSAHGLGLSTKQAQGILDYYNQIQSTATESITRDMEQQKHQSELELRKELGQQFEPSIIKARQAAQTFASEDILKLQLQDGSELKDHPGVVKMFMGIADKMGEDIIRSEGDASFLSPTDIDKQIAELTQPNTAYWSKTHPDHDRVVQQVLELREKKPQIDPQINFQSAMIG